MIEEIHRIGDYTQLEFPNPLVELLVPPNEWVSHSTINQSFIKIHENYEYIKDMAYIYDLPPNEISEWYGNYSGDINWHSNEDLNDAEENYPLSSVSDISIMSNGYMVIADDNFVKLLSSDQDNTIISETNEFGVGNLFKKIKTIELDDDNNIYVLDDKNLRIVVLNYDENWEESGKCNPWTNMTSWGGFAGSQARFGFSNPVDMYIKGELIYTLDQGNSVIKKYTLAGDFVANIHNKIFKNGVSLFVDDNNDILLLSDENKIYKMDNNANIINQVSFSSDYKDVRKIRPSYFDNRFLYVSTKNQLLKFTNSELLLAGTFGDDNLIGLKDYGGIFSIDDNLYVSNQNTIIRYKDETRFFKYRSDINNVEWPKDSLMIHKDEYVEAWVYNKVFQRMWDNMEVLRRSLYGRPIIIPIDTGINEVFIRPFTEHELRDYKYKKSDIYIGINEIVSPDVVNRCITQLYSLMEHCLELLISETDQ